MEALQALLNSVMDAVSNDPEPDWRQALLDGFDAVEAERDELLAALENLHDACEHWEDQEDPVLKSAREAIAKARGGE